MDSNGDAVVVWADSPAAGSNAFPLEFQLYTNSGGTLTAGAGGPIETKTGTQITTGGSTPIVAMAPTSGEFAVGWDDRSTSSSGYSTYVQLYSTAGAPLTDPILVGSANKASLHSIAMNDSGFDVLYGSPAKGISVSNYLAIQVQRYSSSGAAEGSPISVATASDYSYSSAIAVDSTGNFVVGWSNTTQAGNRFSTNYVYSLNWQRYTSTGKTAERSVTENGFSYLPFGVNMAMDANDDLVFSWNLGKGLQTQEVSAGDKQGTQNLVDPAATTDTASIAMQAATGNYALSWVDYNGSTSPDPYTVNADTYLLSGVAQQPPIQVYATTQRIPQTAAAAVDAAGDLLVIYAGNNGYDPSTGQYNLTDGGVFADFYLDPPPIVSATTSSPTTAASPSGSSTAATDAVFASYAYPEDDGTLG